MNQRWSRLHQASGAVSSAQTRAGGLTFSLKPEGEGTTLTWAYVVGGYASGGLAAWAAPVDGVLSAQLANLKTRAEAGD